MKEICKSNSPLLIFIIHFEGRNLLKPGSPVFAASGRLEIAGREYRKRCRMACNNRKLLL